MAEDFLSQEEVDALLKGTTGEKDEVKEEDDPSKPRDYNLATQERIVRGRMPTYEIINERFARLFRVGLFNFMRRTVDISVGPVKVIKFSDADQLELPWFSDYLDQHFKISLEKGAERYLMAIDTIVIGTPRCPISPNVAITDTRITPKLSILHKHVSY